MRGQTVRKLDLAIQLLVRSGAGHVLRGVSRRAGTLRVLAYHRICEPAPEGYPFDPALISASPREFAWQMNHVARHYQPVSLDTVLEAQEGRRPLPDRAVLVTFDDGFDDNYSAAFPVLQRYAVPATFFLATGHIGGEAPFWFEWLAFVISRAPAGSMALPALGRAINLTDDFQARRHVYEELVEQLKRVPDPVRRAALDELDTTLGAVWADAEPGVRALSRPLRWEQVCEMAAAGMNFASHSLTHPILSRLAPDVLAHELQQSKRDIEGALGRRIHALAYPNGQSGDFGPRVVDGVRRAGYRLAFSYLAGANRLQSPHWDPFAVRRIAVEASRTRAQFSAALSMPEVIGRRL